MEAAKEARPEGLLEVEEVLSDRVMGGVQQYYVRWRDSRGKAFQTWELADAFQPASLVTAYRRRASLELRRAADDDDDEGDERKEEEEEKVEARETALEEENPTLEARQEEAAAGEGGEAMDVDETGAGPHAEAEAETETETAAEEATAGQKRRHSGGGCEALAKRRRTDDGDGDARDDDNGGNGGGGGNDAKDDGDGDVDMDDGDERGDKQEARQEAQEEGEEEAEEEEEEEEERAPSFASFSSTSPSEEEELEQRPAALGFASLAGADFDSDSSSDSSYVAGGRSASDEAARPLEGPPSPETSGEAERMYYLAREEGAEAGFQHGDAVELVLGLKAMKYHGTELLMAFVKWRDRPICSFIPLFEARIRVPQLVLDYYESCLSFE